MGIYSGEDSLIEIFSARFEPDGQDFLFRANLKAYPVRVTTAERNEEVARYRRSMRWAMGGTLVVILAAITAFVAIGRSHDNLDKSWAIWVFLVPLIAVFSLLTMYIRRAPDRRFNGRIPAAAKYQPEEVRRRTFDGISWTGLVIAPIGVLVILLPERGEKLWTLPFYIKLGVISVFMIAIAVQAFRKWRFERGRR